MWDPKTFFQAACNQEYDQLYPPYPPFSPMHPHMRCMRRIENPCTVQLCWCRYFSTPGSTIDLFIFSSCTAPRKFVPQSERICLAGSLIAKKPLQGINKFTGTQCLYDFNMHCSCTHVREDDCPSFGIRAASFSVMRNHLPWSKHINSYICERWSHLKSFCGQVCHLLELCRMTKLSTYHTRVE